MDSEKIGEKGFPNKCVFIHTFTENSKVPDEVWKNLANGIYLFFSFAWINNVKKNWILNMNSHCDLYVGSSSIKRSFKVLKRHVDVQLDNQQFVDVLNQTVGKNEYFLKIAFQKMDGLFLSIQLWKIDIWQYLIQFEFLKHVQTFLDFIQKV